MDRRAFIVGGIAVLAPPLHAEAQPAGKVPRLGVLSPGTVPRYDDAFRQGLRDLGYIEGKNILVEYRATRGDMSRAPQLAAELVGLNVDVIFAAVQAEARAADEAARNAGRTIPIVFGPVGDPVEDGLVASLARPGGTMTGLQLLDPAFLAKQLQILKEAVPRITRVAWLDTPGLRSSRYASTAEQAFDAAAKALGIQREPVTMNAPADVDAALAQAARSQPDALLVVITPIALAARRRIIEFAARQRLPAMYGDAVFVEDGGLMFYGTSFASSYRRAAVYVDRILKGARPAELPVEQPTKFELVINVKTAKALSLTIPPSLLLRADQIIE
ncbi:MAG TPA: ABC transporter substrate-binding protein [Methylomirabilota bacterium]|nr:ABC transporter substrate-binding protein [Methylomirabilota bacterium]